MKSAVFSNFASYPLSIYFYLILGFVIYQFVICLCNLNGILSRCRITFPQAMNATRSVSIHRPNYDIVSLKHFTSVTTVGHYPPIFISSADEALFNIKFGLFHTVLRQ